MKTLHEIIAKALPEKGEITKLTIFDVRMDSLIDAREVALNISNEGRNEVISEIEAKIPEIVEEAMKEILLIEKSQLGEESISKEKLIHFLTK